jgi:WD40 repeat protein
MLKKINIWLIAYLLTILVFEQAKAQYSLDLEILWQKEVFPIEILDAKFSVDGQFIYAAVDTTIKKMSTNTGEFLSEFDRVDTNFIYILDDMDISKSGNYIVNTNGNGSVIVWDTREEKKVKQIQIGASAVTITTDDKYLLIASQRPESYGVIVYNMLTEQQERVIPVNGSICLIKVSHDGKYFATGGWYKDQWEDKNYDEVILWSTETWAPVDTIETLDGAGDGYKVIKFSKDDKYLGCVRFTPNDGRIYNTQTRTLLANSTIGEMCYNMEFLNKDFLLFSDGGSHIELRNLDILLRKFQCYSSTMDSFDSLGFLKIFSCAGDYPMTMLKNKLVGVETALIEKENINIFQEGNQIIIETKNINFPSLNVEIYDLLGTVIYTEQFENNSIITKYKLDKNLPSGIFIVKVKAGAQDYSQKIKIVR